MEFYDYDLLLGDSLTPRAAETFLALLLSVTERYKFLPDSTLRLHFLKLQIDLIEVRLLSLKTLCPSISLFVHFFVCVCLCLSLSLALTPNIIKFLPDSTLRLHFLKLQIDLIEVRILSLKTLCPAISLSVHFFVCVCLCLYRPHTLK